MLAKSYSYTPEVITVKAGEPVVLKVKKKGIIPHDLVIDDPASGLNIHKKLSSRGVEIRFTPTNKGEFPIYCSKEPPFGKTHREKGMHGILRVE